ncbi:hypothetical protein H6776_01635 [Candidatus Nomurabacteria bacterium]|nr:hypothetical protein [Candidatus Nomurabacteria bacterium]
MKTTTQTIKYILVATITALLTIAMTVFAAYPATPYAPGDSLDPSCNHGDSNCYVDIGVSASNGLSIDGTSGAVRLGGLLNDSGFYTNITGDSGTQSLGITELETFQVQSEKDLFLESNDRVVLRANNTSDRTSIQLNKNFLELSSGSFPFRIRTSAIDNSTATNGQVLTLVGASTGEVEYQNAAAGILPAYADDTTAGAGGLVAGQYYQTDGTAPAPLDVPGIVMIKQ